MRILIINSFFAPLTTGSAHFSFDMAREYRKQGHEVVVVTSRPRGSLEFELIDGISIHRFATMWIKPGKLSFNYSLPFVTRIANVRRLSAIFKEFSPEVVHQNGQFFDLTILSSIIARRRSTPRVLTIHTPLTHTNFLFKIIISLTDRVFLAPLTRLGKVRCFAVDKFTMDLSNRRYYPRKRRVSFIPASLNPDQFAGGNGEKVRDRLNLSDKKIILSFGHVIPIRNRVTLVSALPRVLAELPSTHLVIVGQVFDDSFLKVAEGLGLTKQITVVGKIPHSDVPDYLAAADVECHDINGHGLGITTFEVMAAGVPVIASVEQDVFPDIELNKWPQMRIHNHLTSEQLAKELIDLMQMNDDSREELIRSQRDFVVYNFSATLIAQKYIQEFNHLIAETQDDI